MAEIAGEKLITLLIIIIVIGVLVLFIMKNFSGLTKSLLGYDPFAKDEEKKLPPEVKDKIFTQTFNELDVCIKSKEVDCKCKFASSPIPQNYFLAFEKAGFNVALNLNHGTVERSSVRGLVARRTDRSTQGKVLSDVTFFTPKAPDDAYFSSDPKSYIIEKEFYLTYDQNTIVRTTEDRIIMDYVLGGIYKKSQQELLVYPQGTTLSSKKECSSEQAAA